MALEVEISLTDAQIARGGLKTLSLFSCYLCLWFFPRWRWLWFVFSHLPASCTNTWKTSLVMQSKTSVAISAIHHDCIYSIWCIHYTSSRKFGVINIEFTIRQIQTTKHLSNSVYFRRVDCKYLYYASSKTYTSWSRSVWLNESSSVLNHSTGFTMSCDIFRIIVIKVKELKSSLVICLLLQSSYEFWVNKILVCIHVFRD